MAELPDDESIQYGDTDEEELVPLDMEQTKKQLRRMSVDLNASGASRFSIVQMESPLKSPSGRVTKPADLVKDVEGLTLTESDDDTIIEEDVTEIEEIEEEEIVEEIIEGVEELELVEEVEDGSEVLEEIAEEEYVEEAEQPETIPEEEEEDDEEEDDEEDEATEEEVREAIIYIFKQEKPIDSGHLTSEQATRMMALPFKDMKEIMKHFELCDNAGEPIQWAVIADIVTPDGQGDDDDDSDNSDNDSEDGGDSSSESGESGDGDEVGSLGSGYVLQVPSQPDASGPNDSAISMLDGTDFDEDLSD